MAKAKNKFTNFTIRMLPEQHDRIMRVAELRDLSMSALVRYLVRKEEALLVREGLASTRRA